MIKKQLTASLLTASTLLLVACGDSTNESAAEQDEQIEDLENQLDEANSRIEELENELEESNQGQEETIDDSTESSEDSVDDGVTSLNEELYFGDAANPEMITISITESTTNQAAFPDHMISMDEYDTDNIVAVTIEYSNIAYGETYMPYTSDFQAYTIDGEALTQVQQQTGQDAVAEGRTGTTTMYWELPENEEISEIELDFMTYDSVLATFELPIEE